MASSSLRARLARTLTALVATATVVATPALITTPQATAAGTTAKSLSNGCAVSTRGIPACGVLMGGAFGANDDPVAWEKTLGGELGVRRTFFGSGQIKGAVNIAKADVAKGRVPWMSFKAPYGWADMVAGRGDSWAKNLATQMATVPGPVWVAVHHEPEDDGGDIQQWKKMQERLGPILRNNAPNLGFSVIVMGYHQFFGAAKYSMANMWPKTTVDIAGFDVYDHYGKNGSTKHTDFISYFKKFQAWSATSGVPWGLAETGISHSGAADLPTWFQSTYNAMGTYGGKAMSYFNTGLNSFTDWRLTTTIKQDRYTATFKNAPSL